MIRIEKTQIGNVAIEVQDGLITKLTLCGESENLSQKDETCKELDEAFKQLNEYLAGVRKNFDLKLNPKGTAFQMAVWQKLLKIPYGKTCTYKEIAIACGNSKSVRAVGAANNKNPIPIFIPCHRVIGSNGNLVGYRYGLKIKKFLLELEKEKNF